MAVPKTHLKIVLGAMTFGRPGIEMTRVFTVEDCAKIVDVFQRYGHNEIDTARVYGEGSSEEYLGDMGWQKRGIVMDTKLYPTSVTAWAKETFTHKPEDLRAGLMASLKALKAEKIDTWYLHGPDRKTPIEDTLREVNKLHQEGYFNRWGVSNFYSWEVARICEICQKHGYKLPSVYQGLYNVWHRAVEADLMVCLRNYGISFYCFNPLAGGFLTGKFKRDQSVVEGGGRFDPERAQGQLHRRRYWDDLYFDALDILRPVAKKHGLTESECALRWLEHHSQLKKDLGDAIIIGASSTHHLEQNLEDLGKGSLPEEVVEALEAGWARVRGKELKFWH